MSSETDAAPSAGALSIDQAVGLIGAAEPAAEPVEPEETEENTPAEPADGDQTGAEEPTGEEQTGEEEPQTEEEVEPEAPAIDPPPFWSAEDKAAFLGLPPEAQAKVRAFEDRRNAATAQALQAAAEAKKQALAEGEGLKTLAEQVQSVTEQAKAAFARPIPDLLDADGRPMTWDQVNWDAWFQQEPQTAAVWKVRHDAEREKLERVQSANQKTQQAAAEQAFKAYVAEQGQILAQIDPELAADPAKRSEIGSYLIQQGVPEDAVRQIGARELSLARKAMLYDRAQAAMKAPKPPAKPQTPPPPPAKTVKPSSAQAAPPKQRIAEQARNRFAQTGSIEDAVAVLQARR